MVTVRPCSVHPGLYESGLRAVTAAARLDERRLTAGLKHTGYLEAILAVRQARLAGADEAIFLDTAGHVAEASAGNVFAVHGDELWTPPVACGILPGITRATVLELAPRLGFRVREEPLLPEALAGAAEAFLTSSLRELVPLVALDGVPIGGSRAQAQGRRRAGADASEAAQGERSAAGRPGPGTLRLLQAYRDLARAEAVGVA